MKCERCDNAAVEHVAIRESGKIRELHLCQACANADAGITGDRQRARQNSSRNRMTPAPLDYIPPTYSHSRPAWSLPAAAVAILAANGLLQLWLWPRSWVAWAFAILFFYAAGHVGWHLWRTVRYGWAWECRVEAERLAFRGPSDADFRSVAISDIIEIMGIAGRRQSRFEIAVRGQAPVVVSDLLLTGSIWARPTRPARHLRAALLAVNPGIRFSERTE